MFVLGAVDRFVLDISLLLMRLLRFFQTRFVTLVKSTFMIICSRINWLCLKYQNVFSRPYHACQNYLQKRRVQRTLRRATPNKTYSYSHVEHAIVFDRLYNSR